ncbi:MAG: T9SS type A sorting domain-containing protein [Ignavibacteriales bacterium]|nr:T9SS type A sorting domain-containing protein [Ignavibacteriales bacterium]
MTQRFLLFVSFALLTPLSLLVGRQRATTLIPGFSISPYFSEQVTTFKYYPEVRIHINAPAPDSFDPSKPTALIFFALPNGNTIEQTVGKQLLPGDDWHFDIQHIGAQSRFLRKAVKDTNIVTIYLEANASAGSLAWSTWRNQYANNAAMIKGLVDSMMTLFASYHPYVVLSSHSGGGSFTFGYMNSVTSIPNEVRRIAFLDSDYNYDNSYGAKLRQWLDASPEHFLSVLAYNDSIALLNGQPFVSATGGTWYRTRMMAAYLSGFYSVTTTVSDTFITCRALNGRISIILKQNPARAILHTVQVELNGFMQTVLSGTPHEEQGYVYYGPRAYSQFVQTGKALPKLVQIPARPTGSMTGSQFMTSVNSMTFDQRESEIYKEISKGNIPDFMRYLRKLQSSFTDASGVAHSVIYGVMPDYLCIGSNEDFCRIPMGPITAQKLANLFGATMPTPKIVDDIYLKADVKLAPVTYTPVGNQNELVSKFVEHNSAIEVQRTATGKPLGSIVGGTKKDVVLSNKITDPASANHVVIYGWHQLNGVPIQPAYSGHINSYVDYSHGIRLINNEMLVDSVVMTSGQILTNATMYKILSNETSPMSQTSYLKDNSIPAVPKSLGIRPESGTSLRLVIKPDSSAAQYVVVTGKNGTTFPDSLTFASGNIVVSNLQKDSLYFIKIKAVNLIGASAFSEVLAGVPSSTQPQTLVVNGFDRASSNNTRDFIRQHAGAFMANKTPIASATNDAIADGLFSLGDYTIVDYILGDESTADETFSAAEQAKVKTYLQNGGRLFVSGCEIAWDLDAKGSVTDKDFFNNYLKMKYAADAPNGSSSSTYQAEGLTGTVLADVGIISFDDGTHGTFDVTWPDVIRPFSGSVGCAKYAGLDTSFGFSAVSFQGMFPSGMKEGRLVAFGFPFETMYPESIRTQVFANILKFFSTISAIGHGDALPEGCLLFQNYPNPFNPTTAISYQLSAVSSVALKVFDVLGREIATIVSDKQQPGTHIVQWNASHVPSGVYYYRLETNNVFLTKRMLVLK